jgi:hypothetical protein
MPTIASVTQVKDFDSWKTAFEKFESLRNQNGMSNPRFFRMVDDRNTIVLLFDVDDIDRARTFLASPQVTEAMKNIGVVSGPRIAVPADTAPA